MENKLKELMIKKQVGMRDLSIASKIDIVRISKIKSNQLLPDKEELDRINNVLKSELTLEDFQLDEEYIKYNQATMKALELAYKEAKNKKHGSIECPLCGKRLYYEKHYNGHIWGKCETEKCISWMQ